MNTSELKESEVKCGVDTLEIISDTQSTADLAGLPFVRNTVTEYVADGKYRYRLNPDTALDEYGIYEFGLYSATLDKMICEMQLTHPTKSRIDFRFDRFECGSYGKLLKLNIALLMLVGIKYKVKNRYLSEDLLTGKDLTARIQNKYFEMEFYNKREQEPTGEVDSRLELRSKCVEDGESEATLLDDWFDTRFKRSVSRERYSDLQDTLNYYLWERYQEEREQYPNLKTNEFLYKHRIRLLTKKQLTAFYEKLGYKNPSASAREYIRTKHLETVNYCLIETYIDQLKQSAQTFMST